MKHEFKGIFERDGDSCIAGCPEIPGVNGRGKTGEEARRSLADAIVPTLEDQREDALRETVALERSVRRLRNAFEAMTVVSRARGVSVPCGRILGPAWPKPCSATPGSTTMFGERRDRG